VVGVFAPELVAESGLSASSRTTLTRTMSDAKPATSPTGFTSNDFTRPQYAFNTRFSQACVISEARLGSLLLLSSVLVLLAVTPSVGTSPVDTLACSDAMIKACWWLG